VNPILEGALVGAGAAIVAQGLAFVVQAQLKQKEFDRLDSGVRRQVKALVEQIGVYVLLLRTRGPLDWEKMGEFLERLQSRIYRWEVSTALSDEEARALYWAANLIEVAYRYSILQEWGLNWRDRPTSERPKDAEECKRIFNDSCGALAEFWKAVGNAPISEDFAKHYEAPPIESGKTLARRS
jgi:hypothetical protein